MVRMKKSLLIGMSLFLLFIIVSTILFLLWGSSKKSEEDHSLSQLQFDIHIRHEQNQLLIKQVVTSKKDIRLEMIPPQNVAVRIVDQKQNEKPVDDHFISFQKNEPLTFCYEIPFGQTQFSKVSNWEITFKSGRHVLPATYSVGLTETNQAIKWLASPRENQTLQGEFSVYYSWESEKTNAFPLYMTTLHPKIVKQTDKMTIMTDDEKGQLPAGMQDDFLDQIAKKHTVIYITKDGEPFLQNRLIIVPQSFNQQEIKVHYLNDYIDENAALLEQDPPSMKNMLISIILDQPLENNEKARQMLEQLKSQLTLDQWKVFKQQIQLAIEQTSPITPEVLDEKLSSVTGKLTTFFVKNSGPSETVNPLYFIDKRSVYINQKKINHSFDLLYFNNHYWLPLKEIARAFDYEIEPLTHSNTYYISKKDMELYVPLDQEYEKISGQTIEVPVKREGKEYVSEQWLKEKLSINLYKRDEGVYLTQ